MRFAILTLCFITSLAGMAQSPATTVQKPDDFEKSLSSGHQLVLDVRSAKEFRSGHLPDAMQANWNDTAEFRERLRYIDRQQPVYVYCLVGARSAAAAKWMRNNGFATVIELEGGINAWKTAGKNLENASPVKQMTFAELLIRISPDKPTLIDIGADWCPPCRKMKPVTDSLKNAPDLDIALVNIDAGEQTEIQQILKVTTIPTFIIYKKGKEVWRGEGIITSGELKKQLY